MTKISNEEAMQLVIEHTMETISYIRELMARFKTDLYNSDESKQQSAVLCVRVFEFFLSEKEGFKSWSAALRGVIDEAVVNLNLNKMH